jgi:hypothetical protein
MTHTRGEMTDLADLRLATLSPSLLARDAAVSAYTHKPAGMSFRQGWSDVGTHLLAAHYFQCGLVRCTHRLEYQVQLLNIATRQIVSSPALYMTHSLPLNIGPPPISSPRMHPIDHTSTDTSVRDHTQIARADSLAVV